MEIPEKEVIVTCKNGYWFKGTIPGEIIDEDMTLKDFEENFMTEPEPLNLFGIQGFGTETMFDGQDLTISISKSNIATIALTDPDYR